MDEEEIRRRFVRDCEDFDPEKDDKYSLYSKGVRLGEEALLDVIKQFLRRKAKSFGHVELTSDGKMIYHYDAKGLVEALKKYLEQH